MILGHKRHQQDQVISMTWNSPSSKGVEGWGWEAQDTCMTCESQHCRGGEKEKKMKSHPGWNMTLSVHISCKEPHVLSSATCREQSGVWFLFIHLNDIPWNILLGLHLSKKQKNPLFIYWKESPSTGLRAWTTLSRAHLTWHPGKAGWARVGVAMHRK